MEKRAFSRIVLALLLTGILATTQVEFVRAQYTVHFICETMNRGSGGSITFAGGTYLDGQSAAYSQGDYWITGNLPSPTGDWRFYRWQVLWLGSQSWVDNEYSQTTLFHLRGEVYLNAEFYAPIQTNSPSYPTLYYGEKQRITGSARQYYSQQLGVYYYPHGSGWGPPRSDGYPPFGCSVAGYQWTTVTVGSYPGTWDTGLITPLIPRFSPSYNLPMVVDVFAGWHVGNVEEVDSNVVSFTIEKAPVLINAPSLTPAAILLGQSVSITGQIFSQYYIDANDLTGTLTVQAKKLGTSSWTNIASQSFTSIYGYSSAFGEYGVYYDLSKAWTPTESGTYDVRVVYSGNKYYLPMDNTPTSTLTVHTEWDDSDNDGIPNFLDVPEFSVSSRQGNPIIFGSDWEVTLWSLNSGTTLEEMKGTLHSWGVEDLSGYNEVGGLIVEMKSAQDANWLLNWLKQFFSITPYEEQTTVDRIASVSCSDGKQRFLVVVASVDGVNWDTQSYWLSDHSPIAVSFVVGLAVITAPIWLHLINAGLLAAKGQYDPVDDIATILAGEIFMSFIFSFSSLLTWGVSVFLDSVNLGAALDDPFFDLAVFDSTGEHVLGYFDEATISTSNYGIYLGRTDQIQIIVLSREALPCNLTITLNASEEQEYVGQITDRFSNETVVFGGLITPDETISTMAYSNETQASINHLVLQHNMSDTLTFKGKLIPIEILAKDENGTMLDDAIVQVSVGDQTFPVSNLGDGHYYALLDTSLLEYGNHTLKIVASRDSFFDAFSTLPLIVTVLGDVNGDRTVDILDIGVISSHWYPGPPEGHLGYDSGCDLNGDGAVDIFDIGITSAHWGESW